MNTPELIMQAKAKVDQSVNAYNQASWQYDESMKKLKELGYNTIEEAQQALAEKEQALQQAKAQLDGMVQALGRELGLC